MKTSAKWLRKKAKEVGGSVESIICGHGSYEDVVVIRYPRSAEPFVNDSFNKLVSIEEIVCQMKLKRK